MRNKVKLEKIVNFFGIRIIIRLAKYAIRVGDQKRHWKKIWREV